MKVNIVMHIPIVSVTSCLHVTVLLYRNTLLSFFLFPSFFFVCYNVTLHCLCSKNNVHRPHVPLHLSPPPSLSLSLPSSSVSLPSLSLFPLSSLSLSLPFSSLSLFPPPLYLIILLNWYLMSRFSFIIVEGYKDASFSGYTLPLK